MEDLCEILRPKMPFKDYANYEDWKVHFERYIEKVENEVILIGSSLGGIFLMKYLSENIYPKKIISLYIVGSAFDGTGRKYIAGCFYLPKDLSRVEINCKNINLLFSVDDDIVPIFHAEKYKEKLPSASIFKYPDINGHFKIKEFTEIITMIRNDIKNHHQQNI